LNVSTSQNRSMQRSAIPPQPTYSKLPVPGPRPASAIPTRTPRFEYTGHAALSIVSPTTGRSYRFDRAGLRIEADPRDRALLASVPGLRQI
jgi:hypothetical protein